MNDKIDVLAVMDRAAESAGEIVKASNGDFRAVIYQDDLFKARAAIAELIAASANTVRYADSEPDGGNHVEVHRANIERMRFALARVGGGK